MATTIDRTNYNALVDDTGGNLDGTVWNKNQVKIVLLDQIDKLLDGSSVLNIGGALAFGTFTTTSTGTKNDWDIDTDNAGTTVGILRCNNATDLTITGFKAPSSWRQLVVFSVGAGNIYFKHQNASSTTAANRILNIATSGDTPLAAGVGWASFVYDVTTARWRLAFHEQGDYVDYSSTSTITGWSSRTGTLVRYRLTDRQLHVSYNMSGTSNSTTTTFTLPFTAVANSYILGYAQDNGGTSVAGLAGIVSTGTTFTASPTVNGGSWTASGTKTIIGTWSGQVT